MNIYFQLILMNHLYKIHWKNKQIIQKIILKKNKIKKKMN